MMKFHLEFPRENMTQDHFIHDWIQLEVTDEYPGPQKNSGKTHAWVFPEKNSSVMKPSQFRDKKKLSGMDRPV
jgi:hypothetical protein